MVAKTRSATALQLPEHELYQVLRRRICHDGNRKLIAIVTRTVPHCTSQLPLQVQAGTCV